MPIVTGRDDQVVVLAGLEGPVEPADRWMAGLLRALEALESDRGVRAIVVACWAGRAAGDGAAEAAGALGRRLRDSRLPVVAAIDGHCAGPALAVALECDIRLAAETARFEYTSPEGVSAPCAARLAHLLGEAAAKEVALSGRTLGARDAGRLGLVSRVVPGDSLMAEARSTAELIASRAPLAVEAAKQAVGRARDIGPSAALAMEHELFGRLVETRDHTAAVQAFFEKTRPVFRGE